MVWVKSDGDIYYNKTSDKAATKLVTSDLGYTLGGPHNTDHSNFHLLFGMKNIFRRMKNCQPVRGEMPVKFTVNHCIKSESSQNSRCEAKSR